MIIDLSPSMQERIREWQRVGHKLNLTLLYECAYYPRGGCQNCQFDSPNERCRWSHILIDTRINPPNRPPSKQQKKMRKKEVNLDVLLSRIPEEVREEIRKIIREGGEGKRCEPS